MAEEIFQVSKMSGSGPDIVRVKPLSLNTTDQIRSEVLVVEVAGVQRTVTLIQKKGNVSVEYELQANPSSVTVPYTGGTATVDVTSTKTVILNGVPQ